MLHTRIYGSTGPLVIVLHGGPAAVGSAAPIAHGLAQWFRVVEPWQRGSGDAPLTVRLHVEDLHDVIQSSCGDQAPALVGASWGAMLALAYAAEHPNCAGPIVLIGCGTFDEASRAQLNAALGQRTTDDLLHQLRQLEETCVAPGERLERQHQLRSPLFDYEPLAGEADPNLPPFDLRAHTETWNDMVELQQRGYYPGAFRKITSPVLMVHGDYDPHPGAMIRDSLAPFIQRLAFHEFAKCGHEPWRERWARDAFFILLRDWLTTEFRG